MADWKASMEAIVAPAVARSATIAEIAVDAGALEGAGALYRRQFGDGPAQIVADDNTWKAAGEHVAARLETSGIDVHRHVLPASPRPKPRRDLAGQIAANLSARDATPIAVGSGVINDLVRFAAHELGRDFLCVATAASMDGYASAGAPLVEDGFKKTLACRPPRAILADLDVIAAAPPAMIGWGYGDVAGKVPAGGDWIIADALGIEPIDDVAWPLVQDHLSKWLADPAALRAGSTSAVAALFAGLTVSGLAMEFYGSSRPASGADHQIAHMWEMEGLEHDGELVAHGACVAVATLAVLSLFDWLIGQDLSGLSPDAVAQAAPSLADKERAIDAAFANPEIARRAKDETRAKHLDKAAHAERVQAIQAAWPSLRDRLSASLMRADRMAELLQAAGAPVTSRQIGIGPSRLRRTILASRFIRDRYTILDLLDETGLLATAVEAAVPDTAFVEAG